MLYTPKFAIGSIFVYPNGGLQPAGTGASSGTELEVVQDFSVEFTGKGVELRGQQLYAIDARVTDISGKGKFKVGEWNLNQLNNLFFAGTITSGPTGAFVYADESHVIPSGLTAAVSNPSGFVQPLTVLEVVGSSLSDQQEVTTGPAAGEYSVVPASGVYTFGTGASGATMLISYVAGGTGATLNIPNNLQGQSPVVGIAGFNAADGNGFFFPYCRVTGVKPLELTMNKYALNEVDFQVYAPLGSAVGQILQASY